MLRAACCHPSRESLALGSVKELAIVTPFAYTGGVLTMPAPTTVGLLFRPILVFTGAGLRLRVLILILLAFASTFSSATA